MNILYLAHRVPFPPNKGDKLRSYRQLEWLSRHHNVWCACFADDPRDFRHAADLRRFCKDVKLIPLSRQRALCRGLIGLSTGRTITEAYYRHGRMKRALAKWTSAMTYDAVVAFSSAMAPYALSIPTGRRVLDLCDLDSEKWLAYALRTWGLKRWAFRQEGRRLKRSEQTWMRQFDATLLISDAEASSLCSNTADHRSLIVGNGVEIPEFQDSATADSSANPRPTIGFVGVMDYFPNVDAVCWFVQECWPIIHHAIPRCQFRIVGRSPTRRIRSLEQVPGVIIVGEVATSTEEIIGFDISVAPLRIARGIQNKVLEAMAAARPVVLTTAAATGLTAIDGRHFMVADSPLAIANAIIELMREPDRRRELGVRAREFVRRHYRWEDQLVRFEQFVVGTNQD